MAQAFRNRFPKHFHEIRREHELEVTCMGRGINGQGLRSASCMQMVGIPKLRPLAMVLVMLSSGTWLWDTEIVKGGVAVLAGL